MGDPARDHGDRCLGRVIVCLCGGYEDLARSVWIKGEDHLTLLIGDPHGIVLVPLHGAHDRPLYRIEGFVVIDRDRDIARARCCLWGEVQGEQAKGVRVHGKLGVAEDVLDVSVIKGKARRLCGRVGLAEVHAELVDGLHKGPVLGVLAPVAGPRVSHGGRPPAAGAPDEVFEGAVVVEGPRRAPQGPEDRVEGPVHEGVHVAAVDGAPAGLRACADAVLAAVVLVIDQAVPGVDFMEGRCAGEIIVAGPASAIPWCAEIVDQHLGGNEVGSDGLFIDRARAVPARAGRGAEHEHAPLVVRRELALPEEGLLHEGGGLQRRGDRGPPHEEVRNSVRPVAGLAEEPVAVGVPVVLGWVDVGVVEVRGDRPAVARDGARHPRGHHVHVPSNQHIGEAGVVLLRLYEKVPDRLLKVAPVRNVLDYPLQGRHRRGDSLPGLPVHQGRELSRQLPCGHDDVLDLAGRAERSGILAGGFDFEPQGPGGPGVDHLEKLFSVPGELFRVVDHGSQECIHLFHRSEGDTPAGPGRRARLI